MEVALKPPTTVCAPQRTFLPHVSPGRPVEVAAVPRQRRRLPSILGNIAQYWAIIAPTPSLQADHLPSTAVEMALKPPTALCAPQRTFLPHVSPGRPVEVAAVARQRRLVYSSLTGRPVELY